MKDRLGKNLNLKIIAILCSVGLWFISININDPYQTKTYSVSVQLQNMGTMTSAGKYVEILNDSDEITVSVRANRSVLDSFSAANIVATADLKEIDEENQAPIQLSASKVSGSKIESIDSDQEYVYLKIEDIRRVQKSIEVVIKNEPAEGYVTGEITTEQNALKISGPESVVNEVAKATVSFDLDGATDDVSMILPIELYDEEGTRITDNRLSSSISEVQCVATILATKEVGVNYRASGEPQEGYGWTGETESDYERILIAAKENVLRSIASIEVADAVDLSGAAADVRSVVELKQYLPEGVGFADSSFNGQVTVTAFVEEQLHKTVSLDAGRIQVTNLPEGFVGEVSGLEDTLEIILVGLETPMASLAEEELMGYLDIQQYMAAEGLLELSEGSYTVPVTFGLPEGVEPEEELLLEVEIAKQD